MADKILNSFDVWIAAQGWKSKLRLRSIDNVSFEGIERLRELILELAILGKLVPQNPSDENANVLLKKITKERDRLIEDGELKKQKLLLEITEDEKPFELPKGWVWAKLGNIGETNIGLTYSPKDVSDRGMPVLRSSNVQNGQISLDDLVRVSSKVDSKNFVENGDLLICARNGSKKLVGKCAIIKDLKERMSFGAFMAIFRSPLNFYIKYFLESPFYRNRLEGVSTTTINQITQENLKNTVIPLPPLKEQHRIVAKVDELMTLCDELEQQETNHLKSHQLLVETLLGTLTKAKDAIEFQTAWATLSQHFEDLFLTEESIDQLKQTILQLAVMGRLVKQDPKDESANVLLKKITKEKERLIETKEIKKQTPFMEISEKEKSFELPKGWAWCRLGEIGRFMGGGTPSMSRAEYWDGEIPWISPKDMGKEYVSDSEMKITSKGVEGSTAKLIPKGSILIVARSGILKRRLPVAINTVECTVNQDIKVIVPYISDINNFLLLMFSGLERDILKRYVKIGTTVHSLKYESFEEMPIPIPPVPEQQRIIKKVNQLFELCDSLKERFTESQKVVNQMANSILEQVV